MKTTLGLKTSQQLTLTPQLQQSIKLLQMSTIELREELESVILENPLLEFEEGNEGSVETPVNKESTEMTHEAETNVTSSQSEVEQVEAPYSEKNEFDTSQDEIKNSEPWSQVKTTKNKINNDDSDDFRESLKEDPISLTQHLVSQLATMKLSDRERAWVEVLIHALDSDGFLREGVEEVEQPFREEFAELYGSPLSIDERLIGLKLLQSFDPLGVGAKDLANCLEIQLIEKKEIIDSTVLNAALEIVCNHLNLLAQHNISGLSKKTGFSKDIILSAENEIRRLNPRPGSSFREEIATAVIPDTLAYRNSEGQWTAKLNEAAIPRLRIHQDYATALRNISGTGNSMSQQLQEAKWMLKNIHQRFDTILRVSQTIVEVQQDFFEIGPRAMKPLVLRDVAVRCELHESTVSRVTNQKYISTPLGCFELKYFFGSHVLTETGGVASGTAIKEQIKDWINEENPKKPLSDQNMSDKFSSLGIVIARRTVAKYRESLKIPSASIRKRR